MSKILHLFMYAIGGITIVAVVLFLLIFFIGWPYNPFCCTFIDDSSPMELAKNKINSLHNHLGIPEKTQTATWQLGYVLYSKHLAEATGVLSEGQVCVLPGDFEGDSSFNIKGRQGEALEYTLKATLETRLLVMCDHSDMLEETANVYSYSWANQIENCACIKEFGDTPNRCCLVVIVKND